METIEKLDEVGSKALELVNKGLDSAPSIIENLCKFVETETPLLAHDIVMYGRTMGVFQLIIFIIFAIFAYKMWKLDKPLVYRGNHGEEYPTKWAVWRIVFTIASTISGGIFLGHVSLTFQAWFAPRLYVLSYVTELVHNLK